MKPSAAFQGVPGAHSEEALLSCLPHVRPVPFRALSDVFQALTHGTVDMAVVPVENSHAGSISEVYDLMLDHTVHLQSEMVHPVHHALLGLPNSDILQIDRAFSHPQALAQCDAFLRHVGATGEPYYDTAGAAKMVAEAGNPRVAAVASRLAGERYGLKVLADGIQTASDNATRFVVLGPGEWTREREQATDRAGKTSLVFTVDHKPGALVRALSCFSRQQVNLMRLESRPSRRRRWEYLFFADATGYASDLRVRNALRELQRLVPMVRVLGSYPGA